MSAYSKAWGLAVELKSNPEGLNRIGNVAFTRSDAETMRDKWNRLYPSNPVMVINLKSEG
jgi:hypothetical protein